MRGPEGWSSVTIKPVNIKAATLLHNVILLWRDLWSSYHQDKSAGPSSYTAVGETAGAAVGTGVVEGTKVVASVSKDVTLAAGTKV